MPNHFNSNLSLSRVVITMGDPAGVGPELVIKLAQLNFNAQLILLGDANYLVKLASELGFPLELEEIDWEKSVILHKPSKLFIEHIPLQEKVTRGMLSNKNAKTVLRILNRASELALLGKVKAIVTAPVHKANINQIESSFLGHTEFFAEQAKINKVVMMLATKNLRMALATTHIPLSKVSNEITPSLLNEIVRVIDASFNSIGLSKPKIAICGINPHAGEDGLLGTEDRDVLKPVINNLINKGFNVEGPYPADSLFTPQKRKKFDVFLAMYHDQGLPVVKAIGFGQTANITLGLPYIRTSVDHGTALDIADQNCADPSSFIYAVHYAIKMSQGQLPE